MTPTDRKYSKDHVWLQLDGNLAKIGITFHAQEALGDIVSAGLPAVGCKFKQGDAIADVESVKTVSNVYSCAAGEVVEVNQALDMEPELLNTDPYGTYIAVLRIDAIDENELLSAEEYDAFLAEA
jgi:glycine cleavage system H protein